MLEFQRCTAEDVKMAAKIERKRRLEEERKARIFNPRIRKIGVSFYNINLNIELDNKSMRHIVYLHNLK